MAIYKNIDGTSKQSFKIGLKGVELSTKDLGVDPESQKKIRKLLVDGQAVVTEDKLFINRYIVSNWSVSEDGKKCVFFCKYLNDNGEWEIIKQIELRTLLDNEGTGGITAPDSATNDNLATFDNNGKALKDSGYRILSSIVNSTEEDKEIPTFGVVKEYIGVVEQPLDQRTQGYNAKIYDK